MWQVYNIIYPPPSITYAMEHYSVIISTYIKYYFIHTYYKLCIAYYLYTFQFGSNTKYKIARLFDLVFKNSLKFG